MGVKGGIKIKIIIGKIICLIFCVPAYPMSMFVRWNERADNGVKINFKYESKDYWDDVLRVLKYKRRNNIG